MEVVARVEDARGEDSLRLGRNKRTGVSYLNKVHWLQIELTCWHRERKSHKASSLDEEL